MNERKHILLTIAGAVLALLLVGGLFVMPGYREAAEMREQTRELNQRVATLELRQAEVKRLEEQLAEARRQIREELKVIPSSPEVAELMRQLSLQVDGVMVRDQTFTAGMPFEALPNKQARAEALPLTVDMYARFDSIFAVMRAAETMDRLIRIGSVRLNCEREKEPDRDEPLVTASIVLEAIYEPTSMDGDQ